MGRPGARAPSDWRVGRRAVRETPPPRQEFTPSPRARPAASIDGMISNSDADLWQAGTAMARRRPRLLTVFTERRTWGELLYALLGLPIGITGFVFTVATLSVSAGLLVTFVGLPLLAVTGLMSRHAGSANRRLANRLTGADVPAPEPFRSKPGVLGWISSCLSDGTAWRARLYLL